MSKTAMSELPQELIDLILDRLDLTDKKTLKNCSLVARSFRYTSQKHLFSHLEFQRTWGYLTHSNSKIKELRDIFLHSPQLALNVRSIALGGSLSFHGDGFPEILLKLVNLTTLSIDSDQMNLSWDSLSSDLVEALHTVVSLPTLTSLHLQRVAFGRSTQLVSLLRCCRNLDSLDLSAVIIQVMDLGEELNAMPPYTTGISMLAMNPPWGSLVQSVTSVLDLRNLVSLQVEPFSPAMESQMQLVFNSTEALLHCHVVLSHHHTDSNTIDLRNLSYLRTLELTINFDFATSPGEYDPLRWAGDIIATLRSVEHVVLNVYIGELDIHELPRLGSLQAVLLAPQMAALRKLTVNLNSDDLDFNIYSGDQDYFDVFPILSERGMVEVGLFGVD